MIQNKPPYEQELIHEEQHQTRDVVNEVRANVQAIIDESTSGHHRPISTLGYFEKVGAHRIAEGVCAIVTRHFESRDNKPDTPHKLARSLGRFVTKSAGVSSKDYNGPNGRGNPKLEKETVQVGLKTLNAVSEIAGVLNREVKGQDILVMPGSHFQELVESVAARKLDQDDTPVMLTEPLPWTNCRNGGYDNPKLRLKNPLIRKNGTDYVEQCIEDGVTDMSEVFAAVNTLQATSWRLNTRVWGVIERLEALHDTILPRTITAEELDKMRMSLRQADEDWHFKKLKEAVHGIISSTTSGDGPFWGTVSLDFRGRAYIVQDYLKYQGPDIQRSLFKFSEGKPLATEAGLRWLMFHGAGGMADDICTPDSGCPFAEQSIDKKPFNDRIAWVKHHSDAIKAVAADPYSNDWWKKAEAPFQFLAWCFEWSDFLNHCERGGEELEFVSSLPVAMDGSCNGLQHISALFQDERLGRKVNLLPTDEPQSIYKTVAADVNAMVQADAHAGVPFALLWKDFLGSRGITKDFTKKPVMTCSYAAGFRKFCEQIEETLESGVEKGKFDAQKVVVLKPADEKIGDKNPIAYLASKIDTVLNREDMSAVKQALKRLQYFMGKGNPDPAQWIAPSGFPVQMNRLKNVEYRPDEMLFGERYRGKFMIGVGLDVQKQVTSIMANLVHSLDAAHMCRTVNSARDQYGIRSIVTVHDSYATHAADAANLARALRVEFANMYLGGKDQMELTTSHKVSLQFSTLPDGVTEADYDPAVIPHLVSATVTDASDFAYTMDLTKNLGEYYRKDDGVLGTFPVQVLAGQEVSFRTDLFDRLETMVIQSKFRGRRDLPEILESAPPKPELGTLNLFDVMNAFYAFS